jgi:hypothetical protein
MTVYILLLAVMFEGETHIFHYGNGNRPVEFKTKEACERELKVQAVEVPKLLEKNPGATLQAIRCIEQPARGGV